MPGLLTVETSVFVHWERSLLMLMLIGSFSLWLWRRTFVVLIVILFLVTLHIVECTTMWGFESVLFLDTHCYCLFNVPCSRWHIVVYNKSFKLLWQWSHDQVDQELWFDLQILIHGLELCYHIAHLEDVLSYPMTTICVVFCHQKHGTLKRQ